MRLKHASKWGVFWHVIILTAVSLLLFIPYLAQPVVWIGILTNSTIHFIQDNTKVKYENGHKTNIVNGFLIDQIGHGITLFIIGYVLTQTVEPVAPYTNSVLNTLFFNDILALLIALYIIIVPAWGIFKFQYEREATNKKKYTPNYRELTLKSVFVIVILGSIYYRFFQ